MGVAAQLSASSGEPASLADRAYEGIRDRLVMLDIRPGDPLNDDALAQELGTGRTPVREALKRLEGDRLVVAYPRRGTFATAVDITDLAHISEIRIQLEPLAASRAAQAASAAARAHLSGLAEEVAGLEARISDRRELLRRDVQVHREIYRAAGNPYLEDILVRQDNLATRIWCLFLDRLPAIAGHVGEHVALLEAIVDGDADKAGRLALEHVVGFERAVRAVL
ncbi:GntR family transcriptional regulator [Pseudonocardia hierapolitana]|uniref:GntR family transcriptional regulator n=1 Tax=Pseudonocardia hierapolitana TaxID=1128676 RepID=A0A561SKK0_9PSEU|nr:GntR family transcriptional regulator [Pseudonocardia hierapolitana]TWF75374.1 GntR family transcriptional regulator [Pseudonocardia hierapolitana]